MKADGNQPPFISFPFPEKKINSHYTSPIVYPFVPISIPIPVTISCETIFPYTFSATIKWGKWKKKLLLIKDIYSWSCDCSYLRHFNRFKKFGDVFSTVQSMLREHKSLKE